MTFPFYSECPLRASHIASVCCVPNAAPHQGILSVSFREIPWLLKKISKPLKFAVVTRSNFSRTDTQKWLASGSNVP
jgi:hypothetical protein